MLLHTRTPSELVRVKHIASSVRAKGRELRLSYTLLAGYRSCSLGSARHPLLRVAVLQLRERRDDLYREIDDGPHPIFERLIIRLDRLRHGASISIWKATES